MPLPILDDTAQSSRDKATSDALLMGGNTLDERLERINQIYIEEEVTKRAKQLGLGYINLRKIPLNPDYLQLLPYHVVQSARVIPFFRIGTKVRVAVVDLHEEATEQALNLLRNQGYLVNINLVSQDGFTYASSLYEKFKLIEQKKIVPQVDESRIKTYEKEIAELKTMAETIAKVSPEEAVAILEAGAVKTNASDMHIQPEEHAILVRFRIDGVLHDIFHLTPQTYKDIMRQLKYKASMKVNIEDVPQDGRFVFHVKERKFHVRVSSLPTEYGESFVMRILDTAKNIVDFPSLGFSGYNLRALEQAISRSAGMILLTGPTGSGKTTTLYSIVHKLNSPELKICTLEDPIEYRLPYLAQSQIDENVGYTFAKGLRALLRQDPDIIMVGEIRDRETGEIAMQAALTGHIVLSTLHTNSSVESISRLMNMGIKPFMIAPALNTVIAQRLVRKVCPQCSYDAPLSQKEQESMYALLEDMKKYHALETVGLPPTVKAAQGCDYCSHTGYKGQTALVEVFVIDEDIQEMIMNGAFAGDLLEKARRKGMLTMMESGLLQVIAGETTLSEVYRVASL